MAKLDTGSGFSEQERTAMKERAAELRQEASAGRSRKAAAGERDIQKKIAKLPEPHRALAERLHAVVTAAAPQLEPKLWYGQPAYARNGDVVCFFRSGHVDKTRYTVLGFTDEAKLDDDRGLWPTSYAVAEVTPESEETITELVQRAVS